MATVIMPASVTVSTDGKTVTGGFSGGTAPYSFPYTTDYGWFPLNIVGYGAQTHHITSLTTDGTTWTAILSTPIGTGETVKIAWNGLTATRITDAAGNAPRVDGVGATGVNATNNSTVAVRTLGWYDDQDKIDWSGYVTGSAASPSFAQWNANPDQADPGLSFVTDATEISVLSYSGNSFTAYIDNVAVPPASQGFVANGNRVLSNITLTPLAAGDHLVQLIGNFGVSHGVRLVGGTRAVKSVARRKVVMRPATTPPSGGTLPNSPPVQLLASPVNLFGGYQSPANASTTEVAGTQGFGFDVRITGSGVELVHVVPTTFEVTVDGTTQPRPIGTGISNGVSGESHNNTWMAWPLVDGLARASAHDLTAIGLTAASGRGLIVNNGTTVATATAAGVTALTASDITAISNGDWVRIGVGSRREYRQVTAIAGNVLTVAATTYAHSIGEHLSSFSAPAAPAVVAHTAPHVFSQKVACIGDSNTQGANEYAASSLIDPVLGVYPINYDIREAPFGQAAKLLGIDYINLSQQGTNTTTQATTSAQLTPYTHGVLYDYVTFWPGVNDIGNGITVATFTTNVQTVITNALAALKPTGILLLMSPQTSEGSANGTTGLNLNSIRTILETEAAKNPTKVKVLSGLGLNLLPGNIGVDRDNLHYKAPGRQKVRDALVKALSGNEAPMGNGMFAA